jgi:hypothetical protein
VPGKIQVFLMLISSWGLCTVRKIQGLACLSAFNPLVPLATFWDNLAEIAENAYNGENEIPPFLFLFLK